MKLFIDSNVFFDFVLQRRPFATATNDFFNFVNNGRIDCATNPNNFPHVFFLHQKLIGGKASKLHLQKVKQLIDCVQFDSEVVDKALAMKAPSDLEDCINIQLALSYSAHFLITRDQKGSYKDCPIQVYTPAQFIAAYPR